MACSLDTVKVNACTSGIGKLTDPTQLLQVIAQASANAVSATTGSSVTVAAILDRACTSGIGKVEDPISLWQLKAQGLCDAS